MRDHILFLSPFPSHSLSLPFFLFPYLSPTPLPSPLFCRTPYCVQCIFPIPYTLCQGLLAEAIQTSAKLHHCCRFLVMDLYEHQTLMKNPSHAKKPRQKGLLMALRAHPGHSRMPVLQLHLPFSFPLPLTVFHMFV